MNSTLRLFGYFLLGLAAVSVRSGSCCHPEAPAAEPLPADSLYQLDSPFTNDAGESVSMESLRGQPVALVLFYSSCTTACPRAVADLARLREGVDTSGRDQVRLVMVSLDGERDTVERLQEFRRTRGLDDHWLLWRSTPAGVRELAALLGVKYKRESDGQFSHSNLITILNREGQISYRRIGLDSSLSDAVAAFNVAVR